MLHCFDHYYALRAGIQRSGSGRSDTESTYSSQSENPSKTDLTRPETFADIDDAFAKYGDAKAPANSSSFDVGDGLSCARCFIPLSFHLYPHLVLRASQTFDILPGPAFNQS